MGDGRGEGGRALVVRVLVLVLVVLGVLLITLTSGVVRVVGLASVAFAFVVLAAAAAAARGAEGDLQSYRDPGDHRVVLQLTGPRALEVIRELRRTTGVSLLDAKTLVEDAPVVVAEGLSRQSADQVADRLRAAGAMAVAAPMDDSS